MLMLMLIYIYIFSLDCKNSWTYVTEISTSIGCIYNSVLQVWEVWEKYEKYLICLKSNELTMFQVTSFWNICCSIFNFIARQKSARHRLTILSLLRFALIGSLESPPSNLLKATRKPGYWSYQRFAGKKLVVVREGISTPNTPYLR